MTLTASRFFSSFIAGFLFIASAIGAGSDECGVTVSDAKKVLPSEKLVFDNKSAKIWKEKESLYERDGFPLNEAKIFFLTDDHDNPEMEVGEQALINHLAKPGDVVLIEGLTAGELLSKHDRENANGLKFLKKDLYVLGWDAMGPIETGLEAMNKWLKMAPVEELKSRFDIAFKKDPSSKETLNALSLITKSRNLHSKFTFDSTVLRDRAMIETLKSARAKYPQSKIFVFAGELHYNSKEGRELYNFMVKEDCSVLIPNKKQWQKFVTTQSKAIYEESIDGHVPYSSLYNLKHPCPNLLFKDENPFGFGSKIPEPTSTGAK